MISVAIVWGIWNERNSRAFKDKSNTDVVVQHKIKYQLFSWCLVFKNLESRSFSEVMSNWPNMYFDFLN